MKRALKDIEVRLAMHVQRKIRGKSSCMEMQLTEKNADGPLGREPGLPFGTAGATWRQGRQSESKIDVARPSAERWVRLFVEPPSPAVVTAGSGKSSSLIPENERFLSTSVSRKGSFHELLLLRTFTRRLLTYHPLASDELAKSRGIKSVFQPSNCVV